MKTVGIILLITLVVACNPMKKSVEKCIDETKINPEAPCTREYIPVCGCDGKTYDNSCMAMNAGVLKYTVGDCSKVD